MKKKPFKLIIILLILIIIPYSSITALGNIDWTPEAEKALQVHHEFIRIEKKWYDKLGTHYLIDLTENRILEFDQIDSKNGGGKYACLSRIGEFELREGVRYINESIKNNRESWSPYARFSDISQATGLKIETMTDVIDFYDGILNFVKMIANEQYISDDYVYRVDSEDRKAAIWVWKIHGYFFHHWHGAKEEDLDNPLYETLYSDKNWAEKLNADLPKIRKSLGLE